MCQNLGKLLTDVADQTEDPLLAAKLRDYSQAAVSLIRANAAQKKTLRVLHSDNQKLRGLRMMIEAEL